MCVVVVEGRWKRVPPTGRAADVPTSAGCDDPQEFAAGDVGRVDPRLAWGVAPSGG